MIEQCKTWPSTEGHKNLLLYEDSDDDFVVNAIVHTPSRAGRIHDHAHAWTVYGFVDGIERLERSRRLDDGKRPDYALVRLESINEGKPRQSGFGSAARNLLGKRRSGLVGGRNCPIGALGWSSFAGPSRCQDVQNTIRTKARRRCRSNCLEQWVERKVNSPAASAKRASRAPRWIALIFPIGGILLLDSKQIIRAVFLRLQHAILVTVLKRYAV